MILEGVESNVGFNRGIIGNKYGYYYMCFLPFLYEKAPEKKTISLYKYYGIFIGMTLISILCLIIIWDGVTVIPKIMFTIIGKN